MPVRCDGRACAHTGRVKSMKVDTMRDRSVPAHKGRKIEFNDRKPESALKPSDPNAQTQYQTAKGCLVLGGLVLLMLAGLAGMVLLLGEPMA